AAPSSARQRVAPPPPRGAPGAILAAPRRGTVLVVAILAAVLAGTSLAVDTSAGAAFDAPKRAVALLGTALAGAIALFVVSARGAAVPLVGWRPLSRLRRAALLLAAAALAFAVLAALLSPRRVLSLDAMRSVLLLAALLPLGASDAVARGRAWLAGVF